MKIEELKENKEYINKRIEDKGPFVVTRIVAGISRTARWPEVQGYWKLTKEGRQGYLAIEDWEPVRWEQNDL